jgi:hypothetical protein
MATIFRYSHMMKYGVCSSANFEICHSDFGNTNALSSRYKLYITLLSTLGPPETTETTETLIHNLKILDQDQRKTNVLDGIGKN